MMASLNLPSGSVVSGEPWGARFFLLDRAASVRSSGEATGETDETEAHQKSEWLMCPKVRRRLGKYGGLEAKFK